MRTRRTLSPRRSHTVPIPRGGGPGTSDSSSTGGFRRRGGGTPLLSAVLSSGTFLPELLLADISRWDRLRGDEWLRKPKPPEVVLAEVEAAVADAADFADFKRRLRIVRRREILRLGARELGWGTTEEVAAELSGFADACLELPFDFATAL